MRKNEIKKAKDNELIVDLVLSFGIWCRNVNLGLGEKRLGSHCKDLEEELLKRGVLTEEDVRLLHM